MRNWPLEKIGNGKWQRAVINLYILVKITCFSRVVCPLCSGFVVFFLDLDLEISHGKAILITGSTGKYVLMILSLKDSNRKQKWRFLLWTCSNHHDWQFFAWKVDCTVFLSLKPSNCADKTCLLTKLTSIIVSNYQVYLLAT